MSLSVREIECKLVFLLLVCGDKAGIGKPLDDNLKKYVNACSKVMSSKERTLCAIALLLDDNRDEAVAIYEDVKRREQDYLLQG